MDAEKEQRVAIKFSFKAGLPVTGTLVLVQKAYGREAVNRSNVFRWYSRFWDGGELVEDDERGGCPKSTWTEVETEITKAPHQDHVDNYFDSQGVVHKEFVPDGENNKYRIL